jgi:peptidoglycan/LPS O-acetylase OafA/YrhL
MLPTGFNFPEKTNITERADMSLKYRPEIDGLRAIAVISVVIYHAEFNLFGGTLLSGGFIGVDIFFVISGFLITSIILKELRESDAFSISGFYERRIRRIVPALLTVMLASVPIAWLIMTPKALGEFASSVISSIFFSSNFWFWQTSSYTAEPSQLQPFLHTWTLSIEEQFYLVFPPTLLLLWKRFRSRLTATLLVAFCLSLALAEYGSWYFPDANFYLLPSRGWELLAGALLAFVMSSPPAPAGTSGRSFISRELLPIAGLVLILAPIVMFRDTMRHPSLITLLPIAGTVLIIRFTGDGGLATRLLSTKAMVSIGLVSYSLYLWHFPVFAFARVWLGSFGTTDKIVLIGISYALAAATYSMIEQPLRRRNIVSAKRLYIGCSTISAALVVMLGIVYSGSLIPKRYAALTGMVDFTYDARSDWREGSCFLEPEAMQRGDAFETCQIEHFDISKPVLLLWGDSHAAHLYRGYENAYGDRYNIVQRTASLCPPLLDYTVSYRPGCKELNDGIWTSIADITPSKVVLSARWSESMTGPLLKTTEELKANGISDIDLIGPVPEWETSLPKQIADYVEKHDRFPELLREGQDLSRYAVDSAMRRFAKQNGIAYLSPTEILCPDKACQTRVGETPQSVTQFDTAHLTKDGSIFLVDKFLQNE